jgi:hypothetical protein
VSALQVTGKIVVVAVVVVVAESRYPQVVAVVNK